MSTRQSKRNRIAVSGMCFLSIFGSTNPVLAEEGLTEETFKNPPNEFRLTQYQLTPQTLKKYPQYGVGGLMGFFYSILYPRMRKTELHVG